MTNENMTVAEAIALAKQGYEITLRAGRVEIKKGDK